MPPRGVASSKRLLFAVTVVVVVAFLAPTATSPARAATSHRSARHGTTHRRRKGAARADTRFPPTPVAQAVTPAVANPILGTATLKVKPIAVTDTEVTIPVPNASPLLKLNGGASVTTDIQVAVPTATGGNILESPKVPEDGYTFSP